MVDPKVVAKVAAVNERLRLARSPVRLKIIGGAIAIRATLPPPPGSLKSRPYQQEVRLGLPAVMQSLPTAQAKARILENQLIGGGFEWAFWRGVPSPTPKTAGEWIAEFEAWYRDTHKLEERTWRRGYAQSFAYIESEAILTAEILTKAARRTKPNTCGRKRDCEKLQLLANYAKIDVDLKQYRGQYSVVSVADRKLPTDAEIVEAVLAINNPGWRWIAGAIAAWGLRPHEAFFAKPADDGGCNVTKGKTGPRLVESALYPEWVDLFDLTNQRLPGTDAERQYQRGRLGDTVSTRFRSEGIEFAPYDLRHAWAVRAAVAFELPVTIAAAEMGHSPDLHLKVYHRHITAAQKSAGVRRALDKPDRPRWN